jgi:hypothetical protein
MADALGAWELGYDMLGSRLRRVGNSGANR